MEHDIEWKGRYKSELLMVCHKDAQAMYAVGAINEKEMREYDRDCLVSFPQIACVSTGVPEQKPSSIF